MDHAITIGMVVEFVLVIGGLVGLCAVIFISINAFMETFRSGH